MRKLLRSMAKAKMERMGYSKVNRRMAYGHWREVLGKGAYPRLLWEEAPEQGKPAAHPEVLRVGAMMTAFRVTVLIVLAVTGLGVVADGAGGRKEYVSTFLVSGVLFLASIAVEALL